MTVTPMPSPTVPQIVLNFAGAFSPVDTNQQMEPSCRKEYHQSLKDALTQLEARIQRRFIPCNDIYIDITKNITVTINQKRVCI